MVIYRYIVHKYKSLKSDFIIMWHFFTVNITLGHFLN